ncbi:MAG: phosphoribosylamine--glycine ligase [Planctomycetes bacterium]|nr:phosphoribosylamine--glycine ligase [Planctomycetota bacterium]
MKVLVVGGGGREHALAWKIARSPLAPEVLCAPGNPGTAQVGRNVAVAPTDLVGLVALAKQERPDLVVIGPEDPLVLGLADVLRAAGLRVFGPGAAGARLEGSKVFAKEVLDRHRIPTAAWRCFDRSGVAKSYLESCTQWPQVVKAEGLASGKGVFVVHDAREACAAVDAVMEKRVLGAAGARIVVEECLVGEEASCLSITDGETILILEPVMDHKQVGEGDTGPNTGGMGVYSPVPSLTKRLVKQVEQRVVVPSVHALRREEIQFRGVLYAGLMMTEAGPRVLEFNTRFGDPETQAFVRRLKSDLLPILMATADGKLGDIDGVEWDERVCVGVVAAAEGYPGTVRKGDPIDGLAAAEAVEEVVVFQAGTQRTPRGDLVTAGGRVLCITAMGQDLAQARARAYEAYDRIHWQGKFCRRDIGIRETTRKVRAPEAESSAERSASGADAPRRPARPGAGRPRTQP